MQVANTEIQRRVDPHSRLKKFLWDLNWESYFPHLEKEIGISTHCSTFQEFIQFINENHSEILVADTPDVGFLGREISDAKIQYYRNFGNFFIFKEQDKKIGVFLGTPLDWSSYYLRYTWILPEYRGRKFYQKFLEYFLACLKEEGVERAEGDIPPTNGRHIHIFSKLGFKINGLNLSERWGTTLRLTRFLSARHDDVFMRQFIGPEP